MPNAENTILINQQRLKVLRDLALIDSPAEMIYDKVTILASKVLGVPVSLVSMVAADYQFFKSYVGLPEPWASERRTPLSHSFCQHVVASNEPLIITDAREHELVRDNMAIPDLNVIGYLGIPLTLQDGKRLGSFCVIDGEPHKWTDLEIEIVKEFAAIVTYEIDLKAMSQADISYQEKLDNAHMQIDQFIAEIDAEHVSREDFLKKLKAAREDYFTL